MTRRGLFITFEGVEGSGKTTQLRRLARVLKREGFRIVATREPGGSRLGDALRRVLLDPASAGLPPLAELLLYAAARADHVQRRILPALAAGRIVLCDRFLDATFAYQGYGRGLPLRVIRSLHATSPLDLRPDLTILLDIDPTEGLSRARERNRLLRSDEGRFEEESLAFHSRVAAGYRRLARGEPRRFVVVNAGGPAAVVAGRIARALADRLPARGRR